MGDGIDHATAYVKATCGKQTLLDLQPWGMRHVRPDRQTNHKIRLRKGSKGRVTTKHPN